MSRLKFNFLVSATCFLLSSVCIAEAPAIHPTDLAFGPHKCFQVVREAASSYADRSHKLPAKAQKFVGSSCAFRTTTTSCPYISGFRSSSKGEEDSEFGTPDYHKDQLSFYIIVSSFSSEHESNDTNDGATDLSLQVTTEANCSVRGVAPRKAPSGWE